MLVVVPIIYQLAQKLRGDLLKFAAASFVICARAIGSGLYETILSAAIELTSFQHVAELASDDGTNNYGCRRFWVIHGIRFIATHYNARNELSENKRRNTCCFCRSGDTVQRSLTGIT